MANRRKKTYRQGKDTITFSEIENNLPPNTRIDYLEDGIKITQIEEKVVNRKEISVNLSVESQFIQIYLGFYEKLMEKGLSSAPQDLLTYVLKYAMKENNEFTVDSEFYDSFIEYSEEMTGEPYNKRYVERVMKKLVDQSFFIKIAKGKYQVNPMGFWSSNSKARKKNIMDLAKNKLLDVPSDSSEKVTRLGQEHEDGTIS